MLVPLSGTQLLNVICRWLRSVHKDHDARIVTAGLTVTLVLKVPVGFC